MVKYCFGSYVFPYSWDTVARALWMRYPNSYSTHVLSEDTLDRYVEDGKLFTRRLLVKTNPSPRWAEKLITVRTVNIIEESIVDPVLETIETYTYNVGYTHIMNLIERVVYRKSDPLRRNEVPDCTVADRSAHIASAVRGLAFAIEKFSYERFKHNTRKANAGFLESIRRMVGDSLTAQSSLPTAMSSSREKLRTAAAAKAKELKELARSKTERKYAACEAQKVEDAPVA